MDPHTHTPKRSASAVEEMEEQGSPGKLKLDPAEDLWEEHDHRRLDKEILNTYGEFPQSFPRAAIENFPRAAIGLVLLLLYKIQEQIVERATEIDSALVAKQRTLEDMVDLMSNNGTLSEMTLKAWEEGSFKEIRNCAILRPKASDRSHPELDNTVSSSQQDATVQSWRCDFQGTADGTLFAILKNYLNWTQALNNDAEGAPYANLAPIINSSGTGKSRVVDQLGRKHCFVIPLCLRREGTDGYPPPDREVRDWLLRDSSTEQALNIAVVAFLLALFKTAGDRIATIWRQRQSDDTTAVHTIFSRLMNDGGTFTAPPAYRREFYIDVVKLANKIEDQTKELIENGGQVPALDTNENVRDTASSFLDQCGGAIAVLSFDEAHELGANPIMPSNSSPSIPSSSAFPPSNVPPISTPSNSLPSGSLGGSTDSKAPTSPIRLNKSSSSETSRAPTQVSRHGVTMFSQIRKGLRSVLKLDIIGLYLSTSGKYRLISPEPQHDPSSRLANKEKVMFDPITELGFNQLARPLNDPLTLQHVTTAEYISHLGRPIFGTRWDAGFPGLQDTLLDFARSKLAPGSARSTTNVLACLAARFAVEFRPRNVRQEELEHSLVENHMRYCVGADSRLRMVTIAPSEPLLAEAAFEHLHYFCHREWVLETVAANLDTWGIHQGDRGEFVMSLIWMAARDAVVVKAFPGNVQIRRPWDPYRHSVVSIVDFMKNLLPTDYHQQLESMQPSVGDGTTQFPRAFADCRLWCNHFIQVQDYKVISTKFLCALLSNGIGVLCAPNQAGIDLLWIGLKGDIICEENLVLILGQAKNDKSYQTQPKDPIFEAMDPVGLNICARYRSIPIIRIVFALASGKPGITLVESPPRQSQRLKESKKPEFTSYDFWFAGVDPSTFGCVTAKEAGYYRDLLASSQLLYNRPFPVPRDLGDLPTLVDLKKETEGIGEARVDMRRAANSMRMALKPHFPDMWHDLLFKGKEKEKGG